MIDITKDVERYTESLIKQYPCTSNRASSLDDNCLRRLYYKRTQWQDAKPVDVGLQGIFSTGNDLEPVVDRILAQAGEKADVRWRIVGDQANIDHNMQARYNITGHIDGILQEDMFGEWINKAVIDIKTSSPYVFQKMNTEADLNLFPWTRKYRGQMQIYMLGMNMEHGCLIFVNKQNIYQMKTVWLTLDYEYAEGLLQRAEAVNMHVEADNIPPKLVCRPEECGGCAFEHICLPDMQAGEGMKLIDSPDLVELLDEREELAAAYKRYNTVEAQLKERLTKGQDMITGDFVITWKEIEKNIKAVEAHKRTEYRKKIVCTKPKQEDIDEVA